MIPYRYMRAIVIFDLPVSNKKERKLATCFRRFLLDDGFEMLQYSVYTRLCPDRDNANTHLDRIKKVAPKEWLHKTVDGNRASVREHAYYSRRKN